MLSYEVFVSSAVSPAVLNLAFRCLVKFSTQYRDELIGDVISEVGKVFGLPCPAPHNIGQMLYTAASPHF